MLILFWKFCWLLIHLQLLFGNASGILIFVITDSSFSKIILVILGCKKKVPVKPELSPAKVIILITLLLLSEYCNDILLLPEILAKREGILQPPHL